MDLHGRGGGHGVDLVLGEDGEPEQDQHHDDRDHDVGDLEGDVVLELAGISSDFLRYATTDHTISAATKTPTTMAAMVVPAQSRNSSCPCLVDPL